MKNRFNTPFGKYLLIFKIQKILRFSKFIDFSIFDDKLRQKS